MKFDIYGLTFDETTPFVNGNKKKTPRHLSHIFLNAHYIVVRGPLLYILSQATVLIFSKLSQTIFDFSILVQGRSIILTSIPYH